MVETTENGTLKADGAVVSFGKVLMANTEQLIKTHGDKPVTIADVRAWYCKDDGIVHASGLREVLKYLIQTNIRTEFENDSYLDALVLTDLMFERSISTIRMFTGPNCVTFLQTLDQSFTAALERLHSTGGKVQILTLAETVPDYLATRLAKFKGTLDIALGKMRPGASPLGHFFVFDSKMARIEQPHEPLTEDTPVDAIKAKVCFNDPARSQMLESRFAALWDVVRPQKPASLAVSSAA